MAEQLRAALEFVPLWLMGLGIFALLWLSAAAGRFWRGRRSEEGEKDAGLVVSASLGLLALLLGFTVSMAVSRFDSRRAALVTEANAIEDFFLRTDILPPAHRRLAQQKLDIYLAARIQVSEFGQRADGVAEAKKIASASVRPMWNQLMALYPAGDTASRILLVEQANAMFGAAANRDAALGARLPSALLLLLIVFPVSTLVLIGYVSGMSKGIYLTASTEMILLLTCTLLLVIDLDRPRSGSILVNDQPLRAVQLALREQLALPLPDAINTDAIKQPTTIN